MGFFFSLVSSCLRPVPSALTVHRPILPAWMRVTRNLLPSGDQHRCWRKSRLPVVTAVAAAGAGGWAGARVGGSEASAEATKRTGRSKEAGRCMILLFGV